MKPWIKRTVFTLLGASILVGGLSACGHRGGGMGFGPVSEQDAAKFRERAVDHAAKALALDDAQKQRLGVVFDKAREQRNALMGSGADPRAPLQALVSGPRFDRAAAAALVDEKTGAVRSKSPDLINAMADFYDSLKPEQQVKLREFMAERRHGRWRNS